MTSDMMSMEWWACADSNCIVCCVVLSIFMQWYSKALLMLNHDAGKNVSLLATFKKSYKATLKAS